MFEPIVLVHGGAWAIPDELVADHLRGCERAAEQGAGLLRAGRPAEDAVEAAVAILEDDPVFDAGRGSFLNAEGRVELDAAMMEGRHLAVGAVAAVADVRHPVTLARRIMDSPHAFLVGEGASHFARSQGIPPSSQDTLIVPRELALWQRFRQNPELAGDKAFGAAQSAGDTVGAIALDQQGHLAAAVSTGGRPFKVPGRVGDVPCVDCGFYAEDGVGAAVSTGDGEAILRIVMAKRAVDAMAAGASAQAAAQEAIDYLLQRVGGRAGIIVLDGNGNMGHAHSTPRMARAWRLGADLVSRIS